MRRIENLIYLAGFLDGDGTINAQIVRRKDYRLGFQIRVSISFYQKSNRHDFILWLHSFIKTGVIRKRKDGLSEYTITGVTNVLPLLKEFLPYLKIKKKQAELLLEILEKLNLDLNKKEFIKLCEKVDRFEELNDSKKRTITSKTVKLFFNTISP